MTGSDGLTVDGAGGLLAGRYRLRSRLGAGAMGVVWLALDERLERLVAVKQLWPGPVRSAEARQRVMREGRIAARLRHPHAVTVHDVAEHDGQPVLVMEYLPSRSLAAVVADQGPLAPEAVARIGVQAASALAAAHAAGIVHRDVKPGNVLVGDEGTVKIADFGISHATGDVTLTQAGVVAGTPAFLAPEIARGQLPTPDSDVFSLGSTLYAAVEGEPPFGAEDGNAIALLHRVAAGEVPPPGRAGPLGPVLLAMLRADPAQRPAIVQVGAALQAVAEGRPVPPRTLNLARARTQPVLTPSAPTVPVTPVGGGTRLDQSPAAPPPANRRRFLLPAAAALLALLAVVVLVTQLTPDPPAPVQPAPAAALDPATLTRTVSEYYALLPARPDNAWTRLSPTLQAQGQTTYRAYWSTITGLAITTPPEVVADNTVSVAIAYTFADGRTVTETHRLGLIPSAPAPLIDSDAVLSSETSTPPPPPPPAPTTAAENRQGEDKPQERDHRDEDGDRKGRDKKDDD